MRQKMTFMILPVGLTCNIACKYCYHGVASKTCKQFETMPIQVLRKIIHEAQNFSLDIDFLWHGGEPLLAGINHFQEAINIQKQISFNGRVRNIIQSNLTLLSEELCDFFAKKNFILSTSIDGCRESHDTNRINANGLGTYDQVLDGISMWKKRGKSIGAVSLITKSNVNIPTESFASLKESGITSCNFHFCAQDETSSISTIPSDEETLVFLKKVFDVWLEDDNPDFPIRNFRNVLRMFCGGKPLDCTSNIDGCFGFIAITANGDVYPCHRFVERKDFCIGNILETSLLEIYNKAIPIYQEMCSINEKCYKCEWLNACGNGCAFERMTMKGSFKSTTPECWLKKELFSYIRDNTSNLF